MRKLDTEKLSLLPKVVQQGDGRCRTWNPGLSLLQTMLLEGHNTLPISGAQWRVIIIINGGFPMFWAISMCFTCNYYFHWRRKWQPTPVFLPGESHGQRSLAGYGPEGRKRRTRLSHSTTTTILINLLEGRHSQSSLLYAVIPPNQGIRLGRRR